MLLKANFCPKCEKIGKEEKVMQCRRDIAVDLASSCAFVSIKRKLCAWTLA
jgi:S-adenosylmethionine synthetase